MGFFRRALGIGAWAVLLGVLVPLIVSILLIPFFGDLPIRLLTILYFYLFFEAFSFALPYPDPSGLLEKVDYEYVLERPASILNCDFLVVALKPDAQRQPFALSTGDKDWQPSHSGPLEVQPTGSEDWLATPLTGEVIANHIWEMERCEVPEEIVGIVRRVLSEPGSWIAQHTRGQDNVLIYSFPEKIAVQYSNEN